VLETKTRGDRTYALVACELETGRQHQIRVHLAAGGTPIVGDKLYAFDEGFFTRDVDGHGTDEDRAALELPRHALHAARLSLRHPVTGLPLVVDAPLPPDLQAFWDE
jgi:23S rRNA pseudouridine1911/1915/1917 synthase